MATDITIPQLGESISEAVIASWLKADGEYVEVDEDIVELETDKVTMPLPSTVSGVIKHNAEEGDTVEVGAVIASVDESAKKPEGAAVASGGDPGLNAGAEDTSPAPAESSEPPQAASDEESHAGDPDVRSTPLARKLANEHSVDLSKLSGTGPGGRVREHDVLEFIKGGSPAPTPATAASSNGAATVPQPAAGSRGVRVERMSQLRQRIASRLVEAQQTAAMLTTFNECDMTNVMAFRSRFKDEFLKEHGVKLGFMSFFVKAACSALQKVPNVNAFITETEKGPAVEYHDYCDIAVAVGTDKGLVVPVLRDCQDRSFAGVESGILELAAKARDGKLTLEEMQGGTFTISNGGVYGSMMSTPILNPPQSGILGMHNIIKRPIEDPDNPGQVAIRPMMYLALSYDHRIVDGEGAVTFLKHVKECIEHPERMLLSV
ncbi:sucB [Symbiodinium necroappetens]|uniref:Dihydrolipoyllysine-residue succinyltransferase component of 2-oxoglutarate dehydrogenase complex n=1 Tax=Symbiodinium necroappetens TaxID=1628268 RepID=A0A812LFW7_9DINO|nr:sucB [Symbiodinium necroappetens]